MNEFLSIINSSNHISRIELVVVEIDITLEEHLKKSFDICAVKCEEKNIDFNYIYYIKTGFPSYFKIFNVKSQ